MTSRLDSTRGKGRQVFFVNTQCLLIDRLSSQSGCIKTLPGDGGFGSGTVQRWHHLPLYVLTLSSPGVKT